MPCNWSTTASFSVRSFRSNPCRGRLSSLLSAKFQLLAISGRGNTPLGPHFRRSLISPAPHVSNDPDSLSSAILSATAQLTAAQVSRAAAQAVRLCIREGGFGDALYVVNSACHSVLGGTLQDPMPQAPSAKLEPLFSDRPVSPRLAAHAFLHGLIRGGYSGKAGTYASLMIQVGIPIRSRTLESVVSSVVSPLRGKVGPFARVIPKKHLSDSAVVLHLRTGMVSNDCARAALELLQHARTFGQRRTERMYRVLFETLLMQGEIIVASLLFVLLLKDWELRKVQEKAAQEVTNELWLTHDDIGVPHPPPAALLDSPYPDLKYMGRITDSIENAFSHIPDSVSALYPYLQSLAILAMLLDTGQLHTHRIASIVSALYRCPKINARVWILQDGRPVSVQAYPYFHDVVKRLIQSLSQTSTRPAPRLSRRVYNTLLHYALRHQLSPKMASQVLHHMCVQRVPPIPPDIVTYNILLRSGTLMRQIDISEKVLYALRLQSRQLGVRASPFDDEPSTSVVVEPAGDPSDSHPIDPQPSNFSATLEHMYSDTLVLPDAVSSPVKSPKLNEYTLSSIVKNLTSFGRPEAIADALFDMLPELHMIDHPATNERYSQRSVRMTSRQAALKRAVQHGPYVYSAIVDALVKAREIGLAERVFILAQQAQQASHIPGFAKGKPWCLSVHIYTSMMQCYADIVGGRLPKDKRSRRNLGSALLKRDSRWVPKARHHRHGYAAYVHGMSTVLATNPQYTKRQTSRRNGILLYRSMMSGGRALLKTLILAPNAHILRSTAENTSLNGLRIPKADARFFKAALRLFVSRPYRKDKDALSAQVWSPMLHKLARAMLAYGYDVPPEYRHLLAARNWTRSMTTRRRRRLVICRPHAFPPVPKTSEQWHLLKTVKERGLPVRKRVTWKRRRLTRTTSPKRGTV